MMLKKIFLSYNHNDINVMNQLQKQLHVHGLSTWRDRNDLRYGKQMERTCREQVSQSKEIDSYLLIVSDNSIKSNAVLNWELEEAINRNREDETFMLYFYLHKIDANEAREKLREKFPDFDLFHQLFVAYPEPKLKPTLVEVHIKMATEILKYKLDVYREQGGIEGNALVLNYETRSINSMNKAHLEINLCDYYQERVPTREEWEREILPALKRVKNIVDSVGIRTIEVQSSANLTAFLALGYSFPERGGYHFRIEGEFSSDGVEKKEATCSTSEWKGLPYEGELLLEDPVSEVESRPSAVILEVSIIQDVHHDVEQYKLEHSVTNCVNYSLKSPELVAKADTRVSVRDPQHAFQIACQFERYVHKIRETHKGVPIYLFVTASKGVALMMGHRIREFDEVHIHDFYGKKYHESVLLR